VVVLHDGGIAGELSRAEATESAIMALATGGDRTEGEAA
jgi:ABC-type sugar transport system ATPase subunit